MSKIQFDESDFNLTETEIQEISEEAHLLLFPEQQAQTKLSLNNIQTLIKKDYQTIVSILNKKGNITPEVERICLIRIFQHLTQLRTILTGQEYVLQVGLNSGETWESPLTGLFDESRGKLEIQGGNIQYHIEKVEKGINAIEGFNSSLDRLMNKLFTTSLGFGPVFLYQHSRGGTPDQGVFWKSPNFAGYGTNSIAHYFIPNNNGNFYTADTAKYYNKGHVYEWYLADINKMNSNKYDPQPLAFMKKHEKDNIAFLQAGDYARKVQNNKNEYIIQAVQVKRENNKKLISYTQLKNSLQALLVLCDSTVSQRVFRDTVRKVFMSKDRSLNKGALSQLNRVMKELF